MRTTQKQLGHKLLSTHHKGRDSTVNYQLVYSYLLPTYSEHLHHEPLATKSPEKCFPWYLTFLCTRQKPPVLSYATWKALVRVYIMRKESAAALFLALKIEVKHRRRGAPGGSSLCEHGLEPAPTRQKFCERRFKLMKNKTATPDPSVSVLSCCHSHRPWLFGKGHK